MRKFKLKYIILEAGDSHGERGLILPQLAQQRCVPHLRERPWLNLSEHCGQMGKSHGCMCAHMWASQLKHDHHSKACVMVMVKMGLGSWLWRPWSGYWAKLKSISFSRILQGQSTMSSDLNPKWCEHYLQVTPSSNSILAILLLPMFFICILGL